MDKDLFGQVKIRDLDLKLIEESVNHAVLRRPPCVVDYTEVGLKYAPYPTKPIYCPPITVGIIALDPSIYPASKF